MVDCAARTGRGVVESAIYGGQPPLGAAGRPMAVRGRARRDTVPRTNEFRPLRCDFDRMTSPRVPDRLSRLVQRAAGASARRPRTVIVLWLLFVVGCFAAGSMTGTQTLTDAEWGVGESALADERQDAAGLDEPAAERVLVRSDDPAAARAAALALDARFDGLREVAPSDDPPQAAEGGRAMLVQATLRGDPEDAADHVAPLERAVAAVRSEHPGVTLQQAGDGTIERAFDGVLEEDLKRAELISVPLTLVILVLAFGAVVAAAVPLLLGLTSLLAALGALGVVSQAVPVDGAASSLVVLIGLAVAVDYSLFYIRREREERRAGRGRLAAVDAAAATVGRAVLVSGLTVMVALAGLLVTGLNVFAAMAIGTMLVVAIAVIGSLTVLPAVLALLGDRIDRWRLWRRRRRGAGAWARLAALVTRRPVASLVTSVCLLGALAVPAIDMRTADTSDASLPDDVPAMSAHRAIERAFPGAPADADLVVTGARLDRGELERLGERALAVTGGTGRPEVRVAQDGRTALVSVPMPDRGVDAERATVAELRDMVPEGVVVGGAAAGDADFTGRLDSRTPLVIAFVLGLALVLLVAAFGSPLLALATMALNLLSVGAAYGVLVAVFQHSWAEGVLDFSSTGTITNWIPLFAFVILFGLSMDYTVLVLERIREARRAGLPPHAAAAEGVGATAGAVTSAAVVMVGVFSVFAMLRMVEMKQLGVGLAAAVLIDATIVRGIALPAVVTLLGERGWRVRPSRLRARAPRLEPVADGR
jgi:uncharacterized membrane protein YdfJ with MMPL/SSD domain